MTERKDTEDAPEKGPAQSPTLPGPTYTNPNEEQEYAPPTERVAAVEEWATPTDGPEPGADEDR